MITMTDALSTLTNSLLGNTLSSHPKLTDGGPELYAIPYQVHINVNKSDGKLETFASVAEDLFFRTQNLTGYSPKANQKRETIGVTAAAAFKPNVVADVFGLKDVQGAAKMLGRHYHQDTRVGANDAINCLWQFNRDDDILHKVFVSSDVEGNPMGLGRVYANTTQTNQQIAYFTFGVPYYTSIVQFHKHAFNEKLITINQQGYDSDEGNAVLTEIIGEAAGFIISLPVIPFKLFYEVMHRSSYNYAVNRFYELRARMQLYYRYVDTMLAHWLTASGMYGVHIPISKSNPTANPEYVPDALRHTGLSIWEIVSRRAANAGVLHKDKDNAARIEYVKKSLYGDTSIPYRYGLEKGSVCSLKRMKI